MLMACRPVERALEIVYRGSGCQKTNEIPASHAKPSSMAGSKLSDDLDRIDCCGAMGYIAAVCSGHERRLNAVHSSSAVLSHY
jgi:hypothetical protein